MSRKRYRYGKFDIILEWTSQPPRYHYRIRIEVPEKGFVWETSAWTHGLDRLKLATPNQSFIWNVIEDLWLAHSNPEKWMREERDLDALRAPDDIVERARYAQDILQGARIFGPLILDAIEQVIREQRRERFREQVEKHPTAKDWFPRKK